MGRGLTLLVAFCALASIAGCDGDATPDAAVPIDAAPSTDAALPADAAPPIDAARPDAGAAVDPSGPGPLSTMERTDTVRRAGRNTPVVAYVPEGAGEWPLVVFLPGFQLESRRYAALCERVASHGFVVVRADPPASLLTVSHVAMRDDAVAVIAWARESLPVGGSVGVMGHSLGGKVATMTAGVVGEVSALLGIDPVNGGSPITGYTMDLPDIVPSVTETLGLAAGYLGELTNATGGSLGMACAPMAQNYQTFYEGSTRATWAAEWTFEGADHMDFVPDTAGCGFTCSACTDGTADPAAVVASTSTIAVAFFRRHLGGETALEPYLTGASVPAGVRVRSR